MEMGITIILVTFILSLHDFGIKWLDYKKCEKTKSEFQEWLKGDDE